VGIQIDVAIARTAKYATRESGDSAELVERPGGGLTAVVVDGQGSGSAAKTLSQTLVAQAVGLIKGGVRDGVVARAVHDTLFTLRHGQVSATIDLLSVDLRTRSVLVTRGAPTPLLIGRAGSYSIAPCAGEPIGLYLRQRPVVWEIGMEAGLTVVVCTDGVGGAGIRSGLAPLDLRAFAEDSFDPSSEARGLAEVLLAEGIRRDDGRPADDMTVVALRLTEHDRQPLVRTLSATVPLP
jgi:hypothetical protein